MEAGYKEDGFIQGLLYAYVWPSHPADIYI